VKRIAKSWQITAFVAVLLLVITACSSPGSDDATTTVAPGTTAPEEPGSTEAPTDTEGPTDTTVASGEPIHIGLIAPLTGPFSVVSEDLIAGWEMYWEDRGSTIVAGREIIWHAADDANDPATGITQANGLVSQQNVSMIVGPVTTAVGSAVAEEMNRQGIPVFTPVLSDDNVTQRSPLEGVVRIAGWTASQVTHVAGAWAADQGYETAATICFDLQFGYEHCGGFANTFTDGGGDVTLQLWHPIGVEDFATFVSQLSDANPDVVFVGNSGPDAVRFVQAWADFGLKDQIPLIATETTLDQTSLRGLSAEAADGLISVGHWAEGWDAPAAAAFTQAYLEREGQMPSYFAPAMYIAADWIAQAIEALDGDVSDTQALVDQIRAITLENTPFGTQSLDDRDHTNQFVHIRQVEVRDDGLLWNVPIETYEDVSQFWTYDPEEYLAQPAYSREYQGLDWP